MKLVCVFLLTVWASTVNASLIYDFTWSVGGNYVVGEIHGLKDKNGWYEATSVNWKGLFHTDGEAFEAEGVLYEVGFLVSDGEIIYVHPFDFTYNEYKIYNGFKEYKPGQYEEKEGKEFNVDVSFVTETNHPIVYGLATVDYSRYWNTSYIETEDQWSSVMEFSPRQVIVPEPSNFLLLSLGLVGLLFSQYSKKSNNYSAHRLNSSGNFPS
jgi:hypothetical protein